MSVLVSAKDRGPDNVGQSVIMLCDKLAVLVIIGDEMPLVSVYHVVSAVPILVFLAPGAVLLGIFNKNSYVFIIREGNALCFNVAAVLQNDCSKSE